MKNKRHQLRPFPGLRPFNENENYIFFGREGQSDELLNRLKRTHFVAVVGTSGSGKSSLVRAGLLPSLYGGFMPGQGSHWRVAVFRPGNAPIRNLAMALVNQARIIERVDHDPESDIFLTEVGLRRSTLGLVETVRLARRPKQENLLIVVDQFEELFRFTRAIESEHSEDEAAAFVKLLLEAASQNTYPIFVVLTMRSDFIGDCDQFINLPEAINKGQYLIPRMNRDQRRRAVCGPIAVGKAKISEVLINRLLNDVGDNPDQLPIFQHALMRTWDYWLQNGGSKHPITLDHYLAVGAMEKALSNHANEAYDELKDNRRKKIAQKLFKCLTEMGEDNREIRRPTRLQEICTVAKEKEVIEVIDVFRREGRSFLMPPINQELNSNTLIDISHESLIRNWDRLTEWVAEEAESAKIYRRLAESAALYEKGKAGLWSDPELQITLNWQEENQPSKDWGERYHPQFDSAMTFLDESKSRREKLAAEKAAAQRHQLEQAQALAEEQRQRAEEQAKAATRNRRWALASLGALLIALTAAAFAMKQRSNAETSQRRAEEQKQLAIEAQDEALLAADRAIASEKNALASEEAAVIARENAEKARIEAEEAKRESDMLARIAQDERDNAEASAAAARVAEADAVEAKTRADELRESTVAVVLANRALGQLQIGNDILAAQLAQQAFLFDDASNGQFKNEVYNAMRRTLNALQPEAGGPSKLSGHSDWVRSVAIHPNQDLVASASGDRTIQLKQLSDPTSPPVVLAGHTQAVRAISFSPDSQKLASGSDDQSIRLWELKSENPKNNLLGSHKGGVWAVAFSPQGDVLATGGADSTLRIWDLGKDSTQPRGFFSRIRSLAFTQGGDTLACGDEDGNVVLWKWRLDDWEIIPCEANKKSTVNAIAFNPTGNNLATGHDDGTIRIWNFSKEKLDAPLVGHEGPVNSVAFSPDGKTLASGSSDNTIRLWDLATSGDIPPIVLQDHESWVWAVKFNGKGDQVISGSADRSIRVWTTRPEDLSTRISEMRLGPIREQRWRQFAGTGIEQKSVN
jgi:WD40 repeat protein/energy-coupling factor transporter ATP-binding protein EcfA2